jgi:hypothetical protein
MLRFTISTNVKKDVEQPYTQHRFTSIKNEHIKKKILKGIDDNEGTKIK